MPRTEPPSLLSQVGHQIAEKRKPALLDSFFQVGLLGTDWAAGTVPLDVLGSCCPFIHSTSSLWRCYPPRIPL